ncbi:hypothetical protein TIFTF001_044584 [Ficus carica]|uniref:Uncharacterized protein n=1 Tax=Ficus carica TaxID=3494 RepID=A0AA87ZGQ3_FICCA|nr:hypothetical protein TIFTF001_044584 [Ficus carica]
MQVGKAGLAI